MVPANPIDSVGYYCGRFGSGLLGEPLNSFSNLAFLLGALLAWQVWRSNPTRDRWQLLLFTLAAFIGVGSFIFHSHPTSATLLIDLVPIQVFGLAALAYACLMYFKIHPAIAIAMMVAFFLLRQYWIAVTPRGALGGAITHIPSLLALLVVGLALLLRGIVLGRYVLGACCAYLAGIFVRSLDLYLCPSFPYGVHWVWHLLTALAVSLIVFGMAKFPPLTVRRHDA
jgi:hypothetical protein